MYHSGLNQPSANNDDTASMQSMSGMGPGPVTGISNGGNTGINWLPPSGMNDNGNGSGGGGGNNGGYTPIQPGNGNGDDGGYAPLKRPLGAKIKHALGKAWGSRLAKGFLIAYVLFIPPAAILSWRCNSAHGFSLPVKIGSAIFAGASSYNYLLAYLFYKSGTCNPKRSLKRVASRHGKSMSTLPSSGKPGSSAMSSKSSMLHPSPPKATPGKSTFGSAGSGTM